MATYYTKFWRGSTTYNSLLHSNLHVRPFVNSCCGVSIKKQCLTRSKLNEEHSLLSLGTAVVYLTVCMCTNTLAKFYTHNVQENLYCCSLSTRAVLPVSHA